MKGKQPPRSHPAPTRQELRALQRGIAAIGDDRAARIVALIDSLADRTAVDGLLDPLRLRLPRIRPQRPLRFTRLLFMPLDPVIVAAPDWRAGMLAVPRNALRPLAAAVHAELGTMAGEIDAMIDGRTIADTEIMARAGAVLWPAASIVLAHAPMTSGWGEAGLPGGLYAPMTHDIAAVLEQAAAIHLVTANAAAGLPQDEPAIEGVLAALAHSGPEPWGLALAVMLEQLPEPAMVLQQAIGWTTRRGEPQLRATVSRVVGTLLDRLEFGGGGVDLVGELADAGPRVKHLAKLIRGLSTDAMPAALRQRLEAVRKRLDGDCRARFADSLANEFLLPLQSLVRGTDPDAVTRLEDTARDLRSLETGARSINGVGMFDDLLRQTATVVRNMAPDAGLALAEKTRLAELLAGANEQLAVSA